MQQGQPPDALPGRGGRDAAGLEGAVELAGAEDGVGKREDAEGGVAEVEGGVGELQGRAVHDGDVDGAGGLVVEEGGGGGGGVGG